MFRGSLVSEPNRPVSAPTVRFSTRAMACEFSVVLNRGGNEFADAASEVLERVHALEECMTAYRDDSELSRLNRTSAATGVSADLFSVVKQAVDLFDRTEGRFDPTAGPLIALWRECRQEQRVPTDDEMKSILKCVGGQHVGLQTPTPSRDSRNESSSSSEPEPLNSELQTLNSESGPETHGSEKSGVQSSANNAQSQGQPQTQSPRTVQLGQNVQLNLGAIGKGFALDEAGKLMRSHGVGDWLLHGGRSSILAAGDHNSQSGWPVGIGNPIFTNKRLGIVLLTDQALGTSGSNIQYFRHDGKRYGHILDPRTGWPASSVASVTVLAPTAAEADALSTAFFVGGVEFAQTYCDNRPQVSAILIPFPESGTMIEPVLVNVPADRISWSSEQVKPG